MKTHVFRWARVVGAVALVGLLVAPVIGASPRASVEPGSARVAATGVIASPTVEPAQVVAPRQGSEAEPAATDAPAVKPGCEGAAPVAIYPEYIKFKQMRGHPHPEPIDKPGFRVLGTPMDVTVAGLQAKAAAAPAALQIVYVHESEGAESITAFYGRAAIPAGQTIQEFRATGGIMVKQTKGRGIDASVVVGEVGEAATVYPVGDYPAALVQGDEIAPGLRGVGLYWSDGTSDWAIRATLETINNPSVLIDMARSIYCQ